MSLIQKLIYFIISHLHLVFVLLGPDSDKNQIEKRKNVCKECEVMDADGNILFRKNENGKFFCGIPIYNKPLRDPKKDGCGCFLDVKWKKKWATCPLSEW